MTDLHHDLLEALPGDHMATIAGQVPAKSNCYRIGRMGRRCSMFKSKELKNYENNFARQLTPEQKRLGLSGPVSVSLTAWFRSRRSDLDNAAKIILDCLQSCGVIQNDRQVFELHMVKRLDSQQPRVDIGISPYNQP